MKAWLRLYLILAGTALRARLAYRWNFFVGLVLQMIGSLAELAAVLLIIARVGSIGGWNAYQLMFLYGLVSTAGGVYRILCQELRSFDRYLVGGEFDAILTRPAPTWLAIAARSIDVDQCGTILQGTGVLIYATWRLSSTIHIGLTTILEIIVAVTCGSLIWIAIVTVTAAIGFWTTRIDELQPVLIYGPATASAYPLSIYPKAIRALFYTILPTAFGAYVPASVILQKGLTPIHLLTCVVVAVCSFGLALVVWNIGVSRYTSAGT